MSTTIPHAPLKYGPDVQWSRQHCVNRRRRCCATRNADDLFFMSLSSRNGVVPPDTDVPDTMWSWTGRRKICVCFPGATSSAGKQVLINSGSRQGARRQVPRPCGHPVANSCTKQGASFKFMLDKHAHGHPRFPVRRVTPQQSCETLMKHKTSTKATHRSPMAGVFAMQLKCSFIRKTFGLRQETTNVFVPLCISRTAWGNSKSKKFVAVALDGTIGAVPSSQAFKVAFSLTETTIHFEVQQCPSEDPSPATRHGSRLPCAVLCLLLSLRQPWVARVPPLADLPVPRGGLTVHFVVEIST